MLLFARRFYNLLTCGDGKAAVLELSQNPKTCTKRKWSYRRQLRTSNDQMRRANVPKEGHTEEQIIAALKQ